MVYLHQEKCPPPNFYPPAKQHFLCYNPIKASFIFSCSRCSCSISILISQGHANFGFIDVQYLRNGVFSFEKGLNGQNHSEKDFHHLMQKFLPSPKSPIPPLGGEVSPYSSNAIWKTLTCFTFQSRGVEIISTRFSD